MDQYTQYYINHSGGGDIGPVYRASFRVQRGNGIGSFFRGLFRFVKPLLYSGAKAIGKEALKTGSNIFTDILNKQEDQQFGDILKSRFGEAKGNLKQRIKTMTGSGLRLKRKQQSKKLHSHSKRAKVKVKDIFSKE